MRLFLSTCLLFVAVIMTISTPASAADDIFKLPDTIFVNGDIYTQATQKNNKEEEKKKKIRTKVEKKELRD